MPRYFALVTGRIDCAGNQGKLVIIHKRSSLSRNRRLALQVSLVGVVSLVSFACSSREAPPQGMPAVPVTAATAASKDVPIHLRPIGNVESFASMPVKAQVAGELVAIHFKEDEDVQKGALLFEIDRRPYEQALHQAEANLNRDIAQDRQAQANLARDVAQAKNAGAQVDRYAKLAAQG